MAEPGWVDVGSAEELAGEPLRTVLVGRTRVALGCRDGRLAAISGVCNHAGGPLGEGRFDGDSVVCPWHGWKFHWATGEGEPGFGEDKVPAHAVRVAAGRVLVSAEPVHDAARALAGRTVDTAQVLLSSAIEERRLERGGRKAFGPARRLEE